MKEEGTGGMSCGDKGIRTEDSPIWEHESPLPYGLWCWMLFCAISKCLKLLFKPHVDALKHRNDTQKEEKFVICKLFIQVVDNPANDPSWNFIFFSIMESPYYGLLKEPPHPQEATQNSAWEEG